jgi:hypothetical protein
VTGKPDMMIHIDINNPSTLEVEAGGSRVPGQPTYIMRPYLKQNKTTFWGHIRKFQLPGTSGSVLQSQILRSRDLEDYSLKLARANSLRPYLKNTQHKKGLVE